MASIAIRAGKAWYRSRYVRTPVYEEEVEQRRGVQYRGFGTSKPGGWLANAFDIRDKVVHGLLRSLPDGLLGHHCSVFASTRAVLLDDSHC